MWVMDTERIIGKIAGQTIGPGSTVSCAAVRRADIPEGVKGFLGAIWRHAMADRLPSSGDSGQDRRVLYRALLATAVDGEFRKREDYLSDLRSAVLFLSGYLILPRRRLLHWMFGNEEHISVETALRRIEYVAEYMYLPRIVGEWMVRNRPDPVTKEQVARVIDAADDRVVARHSVRELALLSRPLFDLALTGSDGRISMEPLELFYGEKQCLAFLEKVRTSLGDQSASVSFEELVACTGKRMMKPAPPETAAVEPVEAEQEASIDDSPVRADGPAPRESAPAVRVTAASGLADLADLIASEQRSLFLRDMFEHDSAFYEAILSSLNDIVTWKEAAVYLSQFYLTNDLDPFADSVVEFTDIIHGRYSGGAS